MEKEYTPKLSVVMSVYNGEEFLHTAIESILNQTYKHLEFIIINDGSSAVDILSIYSPFSFFITKSTFPWIQTK